MKTPKTITDTSLRSIVVASAAALVFAIGALPLAGCSKKDEPASGSAASSAAPKASSANSGVRKFLAGNQLLDRIPPTSIGFMSWNSSGEAYKKFMASPWGIDQNSLAKKLEDLQSETLPPDMKSAYETLRPVIEELKKSPLFAINDPGRFAEGVIFVDLPAGALEPRFGAFIRSADSTVMSTEVANVAKILKDKGVPISDASFEGAKGFSIPVREAAEQLKLTGANPPAVTVYFIGNERNLGVSTVREVAEMAVRGTPAGPAPIVRTAEFEQVAKGTEATENHLSVAFLDVKQLLTNERIQEEIVKNSPENQNVVKEPPVGSVLWTRTMADAPTDLVLIGLNPKDTELQPKISALHDFAAADVAKIIPSTSIVSVGVSGDVIRQTIESASEQLPPEAKAEMDPYVALARALKSFTVGVKSGGAGSPFPDVLFLAQTDDGAKFAKDLQSLLGAKVSEAGLPLTPWQTKEVDGASMQFASSPLGIGLFLASQGGNVLLGSSENSIRDLLSSIGGKSPSLLKSLPASVASHVTGANGVFFVNVNFTGVANLVEGVQQNLSMFTGGQSAGFDAQKMEELKKLGILHVLGKVAGNNLAVEANYAAR